MLNVRKKEPVGAVSLTLKYRPREWDTVIGQDATVRSIQQAFESKKLPHAFLFTGPSGVGKTTLARLIAQQFGVLDKGIIEIDAASFSGVDSVRDLTSSMFYAALGDNPTKFIIIDECHALSKAAWQALLKSIEEPPEHVYWALCTTEPEKVPTTIKTRCYAYVLKPVPAADIAEWLDAIAEQEGIKLLPELINLIARKADGSPRQALSFLGACSGATSKKEVLELIAAAEASVPAIELARLVCRGQGLSWESARTCVANIEDTNMESVRLAVYAYATKAMLDAKGEREAVRLAAVLDAFSGPYNQSEGKGPLLLSLARLLF